MGIVGTSSVSALKELGNEGIYGAGIVFEELSTRIDDDMGLIRKARFEVVL
jgi:hypothetical protein